MDHEEPCWHGIWEQSVSRQEICCWCGQGRLLDMRAVSVDDEGHGPHHPSLGLRFSLEVTMKLYEPGQHWEEGAERFYGRFKDA